MAATANIPAMSRKKGKETETEKTIFIFHPSSSSPPRPCTCSGWCRSLHCKSIRGYPWATASPAVREEATRVENSCQRPIALQLVEEKSSTKSVVPSNSKRLPETFRCEKSPCQATVRLHAMPPLSRQQLSWSVRGKRNRNFASTCGREKLILRSRSGNLRSSQDRSRTGPGCCPASRNPSLSQDHQAWWWISKTSFEEEELEKLSFQCWQRKCPACLCNSFLQIPWIRWWMRPCWPDTAYACVTAATPVWGLTYKELQPIHDLSYLVKKKKTSKIHSN